MSKPKIGDESSAVQRALNFVEGVRLYLGHEPRRVILFAEDYDAIRLEALHPTLKRYELVRGPSVAEYGSRAEA